MQRIFNTIGYCSVSPIVFWLPTKRCVVAMEVD